MSGEHTGFKELLELCNSFQDCLPLCAEENLEDIVKKKTQDVTLLSSKVKLLRAGPLASTSEVTEQPHDNALKDYGDEVTLKLLEKMTVNSLIQGHAVKSLFIASNETLDPESIQKKKKVIESLMEYNKYEQQLSKLEATLKEREAEHATVRAEWDYYLGAVKEAQQQGDQNGNGADQDRGPLYNKLKMYSEKMEFMKWIIVHLVFGKTKYDWLEDPHGRFVAAMKVTKKDCSIDALLNI